MDRPFRVVARLMPEDGGTSGACGAAGGGEDTPLDEDVFRIGEDLKSLEVRKDLYFSDAFDEMWYSFMFDRVFDTSVRMNLFYGKAVRPLVDHFLEGTSSCVFAYGPSESGKTKSMIGVPDGTNDGIISRAMQDVLLYVSQKETRKNRYVVRVSSCAVHNELLVDLLNPRSSLLKIVEEKTLGITLPGMEMPQIDDPNDVWNVIKRSQKSIRKLSGPYHWIFSIYVETWKYGVSGDGTIAFSSRSKRQQKILTTRCKLHLVTMAASEKSRDSSFSMSSSQFGDAHQKIAKSFGSFATLVSFLPKAGTYIPYRDTKLTYVLKDSISWDNPCLFITHAVPTAARHAESLTAIKYAARLLHSVSTGPFTSGSVHQGSLAHSKQPELSESKRETKISSRHVSPQKRSKIEKQKPGRKVDKESKKHLSAKKRGDKDRRGAQSSSGIQLYDLRSAESTMRDDGDVDIGVDVVAEEEQDDVEKGVMREKRVEMMDEEMQKQLLRSPAETELDRVQDMLADARYAAKKERHACSLLEESLMRKEGEMEEMEKELDSIREEASRSKAFSQELLERVKVQQEEFESEHRKTSIENEALRSQLRESESTRKHLAAQMEEMVLDISRLRQDESRLQSMTDSSRHERDELVKLAESLPSKAADLSIGTRPDDGNGDDEDASRQVQHLRSFIQVLDKEKSMAASEALQSRMLLKRRESELDDALHRIGELERKLDDTESSKHAIVTENGVPSLQDLQDENDELRGRLLELEMEKESVRRAQGRLDHISVTLADSQREVTGMQEGASEIRLLRQNAEQLRSKLQEKEEIIQRIENEMSNTDGSTKQLRDALEFVRGEQDVWKEKARQLLVNQQATFDVMKDVEDHLHTVFEVQFDADSTDLPMFVEQISDVVGKLCREYLAIKDKKDELYGDFCASKEQQTRLESEVDSLKRQLVESQGRCVELEEENADALARVDEKSALLRAQSDVLVEREAQIESVSATRTSLDEKCTQLRMEIEEMRHSISEMEAERETLCASLEEMTSRCDALREEIGRTEAELEKERRQRDMMNGVLSEVREENADLHEKNLSLQRDVQDLQEKFESKTSVVVEVERKLHREKSLHEESQGEIEKLTEKISALEQEIEKLHIEIEKEKSRTARVQRERDTTTVELEDAMSRLAKSRREAEEWKQQLEDLDTRRNKLESRVLSLEKAASHAEKHLKEKEEKLVDAEARIRSIVDEVAEERDRLKKREQQMSSSDVERKETVLQNADLKLQLHKLQQEYSFEVEKNRVSIAHLKEQIERLEAEKSNLDEDLSKAEVDFRGAVEECERLRSSNVSLQERVERTSLALDQLRDQHDGKDFELKEVTAENQELRRRLKQMEEEIQDLARTVHELETGLSICERTKREVEQEVQFLQESLKKYREDATQSVKENTRLQMECDRLSKTLLSKDDTLGKKDRQVREIASELERTHSEAAAREDEISGLRMQLASSRSDAVRSREDAERLRSDVLRTRGEMFRAQTSEESLRRQLSHGDEESRYAPDFGKIPPSASSQPSREPMVESGYRRSEFDIERLREDLRASEVDRLSMHDDRRRLGARLRGAELELERVRLEKERVARELMHSSLAKS